MSKFILKIYRGFKDDQHWEEFELDVKPYYNVISALLDIQKNPVNRQGSKVAPIVWEQGCLEEVCGSCSMLINGKPRQSCTALIEPILSTTRSAIITLAPLTKFPLVRDLVVDRTIMFEQLKKIRAWISVDGSYERGFGPKVNPQVQDTLYTLSTCMTCGCCSEACPQVANNSSFMGPAPISQARLFNAHPTGAMEAPARLRVLMNEGGVSDCGNAQNCARVCPKKIPLTESIAVMGRDVSKQSIHDLFSLPDVILR